MNEMPSDDDRQATIARFRSEASRCTLCREQGLLYQHEDGRWACPLFHRGSTCSSGIVVVAEAPNFDDTFDPDKQRLTYDAETDPTGRFARELFASVGLSPDDVLFTNSVLCLPAKQGDKFPVKAQQRNLCRPWLIRLIELVDPGVVVTLGGQALDAVGRIERHGLALKNGAGTLHDWYGRKLLPLYHPGRLGRLARSAEQQMRDIGVLRGA